MYVASSVLKGDQGLFKNLDELTRSKHHDDRPNVVLLLDGWNEINEKKTPCGWLTDVMKEEIEAELSSLEGVQVVIAGRAKMDTFGMSRRRWSFFKVLRLERKNVGKYLSDNKVALPPVDDPVWDTLGNPAHADPLHLQRPSGGALQGKHVLLVHKRRKVEVAIGHHLELPPMPDQQGHAGQQGRGPRFRTCLRSTTPQPT